MKKVLGTYQSLCTDYYDLHKPVLPENEWQFYLRYAQEAEGPILEPMCGTGHFLLPLAKLGFEIEGFDASEPMLARLFKRAEKEGVRPNAWFGFLEDLAITERYRLAFIPVGSFNLIADLAAIKKSLKALHAALLPGGKLVLELMTCCLAHHLPINEWIDAEYEREDGKSILVKTLYQPMVRGVIEVVRRYVLASKQGTTEQLEIEEYTLRFYSENEMQILLQEAGFSSIRRIKAFRHATLPDSEDNMVMYECKKG